MSAGCVDCARRARRRAQRRSRPAEASDWSAMLGRILRACARRVGDGDLEALGDLARLSAEIDGHLLDAVARLRHEPWCFSWAQIGEALGVRRQSAQQRFGKVGGARRPGGQPAHRR